MDKNLDDIIKRGFSSEKDISIPSWGDMKSKFDKEETIDELVKKSYSASVVNEIPDAWDDIENQLIIDKAWNKISSNLNKRKRRIAGFYWFSTSIFALVFMYLALDNKLFLNHYDKPFSGLETKLKSGTTAIPVKKADLDDQLNNGHQFDQLKANKKTPIVSPDNSSPNIKKKINTLDVKEYEAKMEITVVNSNKQINKGSKEFIQADLKKLTPSIANEIAVPSEPNSIRLENREIGFKTRWNIGLFYELNYSNLINSKSRVAGERESLLNQNFRLGQSIGVYFQGNLKHNLLVGGELHLFNRLSQNYDHFENGYLVNHDLKLDYMRLNALVGYSFPLRKINASFDFLTGPNASVLISKQELQSQVMGDQPIINTDYSRFNFSWSFRLGMNHRISRFNIGYGISSTIGMFNIYHSEEELLKKLNKTSSFESGLYMKFGIYL